MDSLVLASITSHTDRLVTATLGTVQPENCNRSNCSKQRLRQAKTFYSATAMYGNEVNKYVLRSRHRNIRKPHIRILLSRWTAPKQLVKFVCSTLNLQTKIPERCVPQVRQTSASKDLHLQSTFAHHSCISLMFAIIHVSASQCEFPQL